MQPISKTSASSASRAPQFFNAKFVSLAALLLAATVAGGAWLQNRVPLQNRASLQNNTPEAPVVAAPKVVSTAAPSVRARQLSYRVLKSFPHDANAFTQGLLWHDGGLYESTGLHGRSSLRRVEFPSGRVLKKVDVAPEFFAEGLALAGDRLYQLTWQSKVGFIYDRKTLRRVGSFSYPTEGWGLTFDGKNLILSDGSATLYFYEPNDFKLIRTVRVMMDGEPVSNLNELEWIEGKIWANVWQSDLVVMIEPQSGAVTGTLDLTGLLPVSQRKGSEDVLNGIAYDAKTGRIFVTGKLWPKIFQIEVK
jgi:glutaminyl-peptide cyclotransferase